MVMRRVRIRFKQPVDVTPLTSIEGVSLLSQSNGNNIRLQVEGEMEDLIRALAGFPVSDLETEHPSLEEIFLTYYKAGE